MGNDISQEQPTGKPKLLEQVRELLRAKYYSRRAEEVFRLDQALHPFHSKRHPREMGGVEVARFLSHLAAVQDVSPSTQNQAFSAILFLYRDALRKPLDDLGPVKRAQRERKVPGMAH